MPPRRTDREADEAAERVRRAGSRGDRVAHRQIGAPQKPCVLGGNRHTRSHSAGPKFMIPVADNGRQPYLRCRDRPIPENRNLSDERTENHIFGGHASAYCMTTTRGTGETEIAMPDIGE
jgi:hypothetical protein